ncbi:MAG: phosphoribosylformimino-5-aminoimidazole carboxamide ribotide isomerase [Oscillospiraceae bacterium]|nr:phosphoribosylformimino-5-aminoimidazole carboxamide ribotide isomerase [Oscillospiraceae bacterium]
MRFRPCIDIHNGRVKQIVGGSLADKGSAAEENFASDKGGGYYAELYKSRRLSGGHIIILNPAGSEYYEADRSQAKEALSVFPGGMQIGGGINDENAAEYIEAGASHVIVTSFVFRNGRVDADALARLNSAVGREHIVLDLSCRKKDGRYFIVTDRWQKFTDTVLDSETLELFAASCDEILIHAVDVEGRKSGIEPDIVELMSNSPVPVTYAGGISSFEDMELIDRLGGGRVDFTVGSALDLFGGTLSFDKICEKYGG